ncbi:MAG: response regulator [Chthoniobacterales bacterium]
MTFLKKILLVDNESCVSGLVRSALEKTGAYVIKEEHDSRRAMNAARWFQPDLILCDAVTSHTSSPMARQLQQDAALSDTPVVFLSANETGDEGVISGGILGGYTFLANRVPLEEFVGYVGELLRPNR